MSSNSLQASAIEAQVAKYTTAYKNFLKISSLSQYNLWKRVLFVNANQL